MEPALSAVAILFVVGLLYSFVRLLWDDEMPNWLG